VQDKASAVCGVHVAPKSATTDGATSFRPFASRIHHAGSGIHPIFDLDGWRAAIVYAIRAARICIVVATIQTEVFALQARRHHSLRGRQE
jgi:hypothetical protein